MKPLPEISVSEWLAAEATLRDVAPKPKGYLDSSEYAELIGRSLSQSRNVLCEMTKKGLVDRVKWGQKYLYRLKNK